MKGKFTLAEIKKHLLTAISYLLPLIVASGLLIAIGNLTGGAVMESMDVFRQVKIDKYVCRISTPSC